MTSYTNRGPFLLAMTLLLQLAVACGSQEEPVEDTNLSVGQRADTTSECPAGYIPFQNVIANADDQFTSEGRARLGDKTFDAQFGYATHIEDIACPDWTPSPEGQEDAQGYQDTEIDAELETLVRECENKSSCTTATMCPSNMTVKYSCGESDLDDAGDPIIYEMTSASGEVTLSACDRSREKAVREAGEITCVPEACHGRAKRGPNMECELAPEKPEVAVSARFVDDPRPLYDTNYTGHDTISESGFGFSSASIYEHDVEVTFAHGLVPEEDVEFIVWMGQTLNCRRDENQYLVHVEAFRCIATSFKLRRDDPDARIRTGPQNQQIYTKTIRYDFAKDCTSAELVPRLFKRFEVACSVDNSDGIIKEGIKANTGRGFLHISYDMDGKTVWHKDAGSDLNTFLSSSEPECAPDPTSFFYDSSTHTHNMMDYYHQRQIATFDKRVSFYVSSQFNHRVEVGPLSMELEATELKIKPQLNFTKRLPVTIDWYMNNAYLRHSDSDSSKSESLMWPWHAEQGTLGTRAPWLMSGDYVYVNADPTSVIGEAVPFAKKWETPYVPTKLRADLYMLPSGLSETQRDTIAPIKVGSHPLRINDLDKAKTDSNPDMDGNQYPILYGPYGGQTDTAYINLDQTARNKVMNYINSLPNTDTLSFDVFYCVHADQVNSQPGLQALWHSGKKTDYRMDFDEVKQTHNTTTKIDAARSGLQRGEGDYDDKQDIPILALESDQWASRRTTDEPWSRRGCKVAKTPLVIHLDRFLTPSLPVRNFEHTDFIDEQGSGNAETSGDANNNGGRIYASNEAASDGGFEVADISENDSRTGGNDSRVTMDLSISSERTLLGDSPQLSFSLNGEMFSFSLFDPLGALGAIDDPEATASAVVKWFPQTPTDAAQLKLFDKNPTIAIAPPFNKLEKQLNETTFKAAKHIQAYATAYAGVSGLGLGLQAPPIKGSFGPFVFEITFTFAAGAGVQLEISYNFNPPDCDSVEDGEAQAKCRQDETDGGYKFSPYPCLGPVSMGECFVAETQPRTFTEAVDFCRNAGGHLAEPTSNADLDKIITAGNQLESYWIGAQLAYRHKDKNCANWPGGDGCADGSRTEFRFLQSDEAFASQSGRTGAVSYVSGAIGIPQDSSGNRDASRLSFHSMYPYDRGVAYHNVTQNYFAADTQQKLPFVCQYQPAGSEVFMSFKKALKPAAGVGFIAQGCSPSSEFGVCLTAKINLLALIIGFENEFSENWLLKDDTLFRNDGSNSKVLQKNGSVDFSIPFSIHVFSGSFDLSFEAYGWFSIGWNLYEFKGIKLFETKLFETSAPFVLSDFE